MKIGLHLPKLLSNIKWLTFWDTVKETSQNELRELNGLSLSGHIFHNVFVSNNLITVITLAGWQCQQGTSSITVNLY